MKRALILAAAFALSATAPAFAQTEQMSSAHFVAASECLAYADHQALRGDAFNAESLREAVAQNRGMTNRVANRVANERSRDIRRIRPHSDAGLQALRAERDATCAPFVERGLVQARGPVAS